MALLLEQVRHGAAAVLLPAIGLWLGTIGFWLRRPSSCAAFMTQRFASGLILSSIALEDLPLLVHAPDDVTHVAATLLGSAAGVAVMMGVERLLSAWRSGRFGRAGGKGGGEGDRVLGMDCHYSEADAARDAKAAASMGGKKKKGHKASESDHFLQVNGNEPVLHDSWAAAAASNWGEVSHDLCSEEASATMGHHSQPTAQKEQLGLATVWRAMDHRREAELDPEHKLMGLDDGPDWPALALAESQALVMGLVLGITNAAGHSANSGLVVAVCLTVYGTFLGMTAAASSLPTTDYAAAEPQARVLAVALLGPCMAVVGGMVGSLATTAVNTTGRTTIVAFAAAALLKAVVDEMIEAKDDAKHAWRREVVLYAGMIAPLVLKKSLSAADVRPTFL